MNFRLLAPCSIHGVNWNVIAREALRAGGLARLLAGEVAETARDGEATRMRLTEESCRRSTSASTGSAR
jgi:hypothetical protein